MSKDATGSPRLISAGVSCGLLIVSLFIIDGIVRPLGDNLAGAGLGLGMDRWTIGAPLTLQFGMIAAFFASVRPSSPLQGVGLSCVLLHIGVLTFFVLPQESIEAYVEYGGFPRWQAVCGAVIGLVLATASITVSCFRRDVLLGRIRRNHVVAALALPMIMAVGVAVTYTTGPLGFTGIRANNPEYPTTRLLALVVPLSLSFAVHLLRRPRPSVH